jgi:hypothetical protein
MDNQLSQSLYHGTIPIAKSVRFGVADDVADVSGVISFDPAELADTFQWLPTGSPPGIIDVIVPSGYGTVLLGQVVLGVVG